MIEHTTIKGKEATVSYLNDKFELVSKADSTMIKVVFDSGEVAICYADQKQAHDAIAFDEASVRKFDMDGHLLVGITNISKANICPYVGNEIPDHEGLGLDPGTIYQLLRDPEELQKAAPTFNGKLLLSEHIPVSADNYDSEVKKVTIGFTGQDSEFVYPYLKNSLVIVSGDAIKLIESGEQKELSCGYRYRADMTPGVFEGQRYDGRMVDIVGNHVALVKEGRAGHDVVVNDSQVNLEWAVLERALEKFGVKETALFV